MTPYATQTDGSSATPAMQTRNRAAAEELLLAIANGDEQTIERLVRGDQYIRHDSRLPGGRAELIASLPGLLAQRWQVKVVRSLIDGDYVVTHNEYRSAGKVYAGFEVYEFEGGVAVESWKAMQLMPPPNPSGRTLLDGNTSVIDQHLSKRHKALSGRLAQEIMFKGKFKKFPDFIGDPYIQHNPGVADGIEGIMVEVDKRERGALWAFDYKQPLLLLGEGNFSVTMMEIEYNGVPALHFDLFRYEDGKVREHWDLY